MSWNTGKKKKLKPYLSLADRQELEERLAIYKKFFKPIKGQFVLRSNASSFSKNVVFNARYFKKEDIQEDAQKTIQELEKCNSSKKWELVSCEVLETSVFEDNSSEDLKQ